MCDWYHKLRLYEYNRRSHLENARDGVVIHVPGCFLLIVQLAVAHLRHAQGGKQIGLFVVLCLLVLVPGRPHSLLVA